MSEYTVTLSAREMPRSWYNVLADLPTPMKPPLHPGTHQPLGPDDLAAIFPMALIEQEVSSQREIPIPEEVLDIYQIWRPTPLVRARRLEAALGTPAEIYFKNEAVSPAGSHKPNTSVPQVYYNKQAGIRRIATETGAGQWGSALAMACRFYGLEATVYMVKVSYEQKPYRKIMMQTWGGEVIPSPSTRTNAGRAVLAEHPDSPGSLGIAISEAVEDAATHGDTNYSLGSVLNHVCLHQTVIGQEVKAQLGKIGRNPDVLIACVGGGSNFAGFAHPFIPEKLAGRAIRMVAVEPMACPTLTKGVMAYDYGDLAKLTPLLPMYTLGHDFVPPGIHAGGLRYHGDSPIVSHLLHEGIIEATALHQRECFEAALLFARTEGIIPAPESSHAIRQAVIEAERCTAEGSKEVIVFNLSGHGHFDMASYDRYLTGQMEDYEYPTEAIAESLKLLPKV